MITINMLKSKVGYSNQFQNAVKLWPSRGKNSTLSILKLQSYWTDVHQILHYAEALWPLLMYASQSDIPFCFRMPKQRVKAINFDVCKKSLKLIGYYSNVHWATTNLY